jgi:tRNA(His) guanylyltransferase
MNKVSIQNIFNEISIMYNFNPSLSLGDKIKLYEKVNSSIRLDPDYPAIVRIDGCGFSKYTKTLEKPQDDRFIGLMNSMAIYICENFADIKVAYLQSDEASFLIERSDNPNSDFAYGGKVEKIVSIIASMAGAYFSAHSHNLFNGKMKLATFDARVFQVPHEVVNAAFCFRQQDAVRNSIQGLARSMFSHSQCDNKNCDQLKEMLDKEGNAWDNLPHYKKFGRCVIKTTEEKECKNQKTGEVVMVNRRKWVVDNNIPRFGGDFYIDDCMNPVRE